MDAYPKGTRANFSTHDKAGIIETNYCEIIKESKSPVVEVMILYRNGKKYNKIATVQKSMLKTLK